MYHRIPWYTMETVTAKLTERLATELDRLVEQGWFANRSDAIRAAVRDMVEQRRLQRLAAAVDEDIAWGKRRA
jgi:Arc/MetJ-type ribon-helix-helix transcriptional regulator